MHGEHTAIECPKNLTVAGHTDSAKRREPTEVPRHVNHTVSTEIPRHSDPTTAGHGESAKRGDGAYSRSTLSTRGSGVIAFLSVLASPAIERKFSRSIDSFHREYVDVADCEATVNPWSVYNGLPSNLQCSIDVQQSMQDPSMLLGRGGFGIIVETSTVQVAKVNMFPEMADWSLPFIEDQFSRYAHIATQVEEIAIGVSMKHPNILRTFGGYWCDIPQYPLGGRAVIVMERALFSLQEFMAKMNKLQTPKSSTSTDSATYLAMIPIVELDTLRGLEYLHARHVQHRDLTYRNILVCHQPGRKPVELSFKISDFGTACNYSTPDQQRGNRVHTPPEVLWCLNSTTASDVFSWYCVMWELPAQTPNYMKAYDAETLYGKYGHSRPTTAAIGRTLGEMGLAKVNMFPEMADWSLPFIEDQFYRYAHIATQVEEI
uniref:Protein kinase domain-containing protein n=1 Tax=Neolamprologus brichardi TaxID=32507 RepID=A0A3Q4H4U8_NEOBR